MKILFVVYGILLITCDFLMAHGFTAPGWGSLSSMAACVLLSSITVFLGIIYYYKKIKLNFKSGYKLLEVLFFLNFLLVFAFFGAFVLLSVFA